MYNKLLLTLLLFCSFFVGWSQTIMNWYDGKSSAVVLTFDDWSPGHGAIAVPRLIEKDLVGTFYVTTKNTSGFYNQIQKALDNGCEVGNHTKTHPRLTNYLDNETLLEDEIVGTKTLLEQKVSDLEVSTFCYPQGAGPDKKVITDLVKKGHMAARGIFARYGKWSYDISNYYEISTIAINSTVPLTTYKDHLETIQKDGGLMTFMYHSISNSTVSDSWYDEITETTFLSHLDELKKIEENVWITTLDNAVRYHKEKNCATLFEVQNIDSQRIFSLTDTLSNNSLFNHPLTIQIPLEDGEMYSSVEQDGVALSFRQEENILYFSAVPDAGNIVLKKDQAANIYADVAKKGLGIDVYPVPVGQYAKIQIGINTPTTIQVNLYTQQGQFVKNLLTTNQVEEVQEYTVPFNLLSTGIYILKLQTDYGEITQKLIKQ